MQAKTILMPAYDFKPLLGGVANYAHELAVQFSTRGFRVQVVSRELEGMAEFDRDLPYAITRIRIPHSGTAGIPLLARALRALIRGRPPAAVFCPTWLPEGAAGRLAVRRTTIPYFVAAHGTEVFDNFATVRNSIRTVLLRRPKRKVFEGAAKIFPVSEYTRRAVLREACGDERRVITVNNGVNPLIFRKETVPPALEAKYRPRGEPILLTVTRLYPYKGVDRMLESLPAIARAIPGVRYLVVGDGPDRQRLQNLAGRLGLQDQVSFLGPMALAEVVQLYNLADLFVMLSRDDPPDVEGFGLVFLEAAACGLPSVGGRSGGIPDAIADGKTGWLVDPRNTEEIASTVSGLLQSPERLERASELCLATASQKTWERVADRILEEMFPGEP
jgi:phosphatidylinositol alpha-1,6-mannosyltransferase